MEATSETCLAASLPTLCGALQYLRDVRERLDRPGLGLQPNKTRLIEFGRFASENRGCRCVGQDRRAGSSPAGS